MARLLGRQQEYAQLLAFLAECRSARSAMVIEGEPGIGKTALFDAGVAAAEQLRVLRVRCVAAESGMVSIPYAEINRSNLVEG